MTILFYFWFGTGSLSEMQYQNEFVRERKQKRFLAWLPILLTADCVLVAILFDFICANQR